MITLSSVLKDYQILNGCDLRLKYHENVYHIDDLINPEDHDKTLLAGNKLFRLTVNFTKKTFELDKLCSESISGVVTEEDTYILLGYISKYMAG